jgi:hypothetical protein
MAISTIGGAGSSGASTTGPAGSKLQVGGYTSTGSYTTTIPGGDYFFIAPYRAKLSCNNNTYAGVIDQTGSIISSGSGIYNWNVPQGNYIRVAGQQSVTVTMGPLPISARLASRNYQTYARNWNRNAVRYAGTTYAFPDSTNNVVWTSTNGTTWTSNTTTFSIGNCFMVANGVFFAGDTTNTNILYTSTDAVTWTQRIMPTATVADGKLAAVVYSGSKYVAFFRRGSGNTYATHTFTSTDAITWTYGAAVSGTTFTTTGDYGVFVAASSTTIVCAGDGFTGNTASSYSTTGTSWTAHSTTAGTNYYWSAIEYVNNQFVMMAQPSGITATAQPYVNSTGSTATWSGQGAVSTFSPNGSQVTGINWDGTNWVLTASYTGANNYAVAYGTSLAALNVPTNDLFGWSNSNGTVLAFNNAVQGSFYVNGRWFFNAYDYRQFNPSYAPEFSNYDQFLFYSTATFPNLQAPGAFSLYRLYEQTTLN